VWVRAQSSPDMHKCSYVSPVNQRKLGQVQALNPCGRGMESKELFSMIAS